MPEQTTTVTTKSMFPRPVVKTGVMFGIAIAVLNVLYIVFGLIPLLGIILNLMVSIVAFLLSVAAGYVVVHALGIQKENISDAIMKTVMTGLIVGSIVGVASGIAGVVSNVIYYSSYNFAYLSPTIVTYVFSFVGAFVMSLILNVVWNVVGGVVGVYYPSTNLPAGIKSWVDKAVSRVSAA